ncbi:hypothetical protein POM88_006296 [Heracleum sosnowskyi]|uniref:SWIM-type domain-containing protein n=1 Tax=Heracleum sosnowskyi TaxID=360622 RepID=A0AAD8J4L2_9APIA|nr:hypothetical protein POM88_006296 [Heracleum sosnowskyi]
MSTNEEASGYECSPHVESSDSDQPNVESEIESSESEDDIEDLNDGNESEFRSFIGADGIKYFVPNCDDKEKPQTNQHFPALEDAYLFYLNYGRTCGFDVNKSTEKSDKHKNMLAKYIECNRAGSPHHNKSKLLDENGVEGKKKRRKTTSRRCYCKAKIILKPAGHRGFVIMSFVEEHNHPLATGAARMFLRCNRNVSIDQQHFIMDCARAKIGATRSHAIAKELRGSYEDVGATVADFKNFSRDVKIRIGDHDAKMILAKFKLKKETSNNTFYYDYKVDKQGHLTGLFWTDVIGQANFDVFGDIVSFDPTFRTNRYNMVFVPFTGVDNHWKNVTFAAGLLAKENYKNFKWLLLAFNKAMGRVPPCVITDQCLAIKKALNRWWSKAKHRLCMWHIMNKLPSKVGPTLSSNKKFVENLKSAVYSDHLTPDEFEERWNAVISEYKLESNTWLTELFNIRDQWIPAYFSDIEMAGLLRTTSRSESSNFFFQHFHESGDTLVEFYSSFESAMDKQRLRYAENENRSEQIPTTDTTMSIEKDASKLYTLEIFYLVREEIKTACYHTTMQDMTKDNEKRHFKCKDDLLHDKIFEVSVRLSDNYVQCSCKFFNRKGYLCRHAFAALHQCSVKHIPAGFIKPRWSKNAIKRHSFLGSSQLKEICEARDRKKLKRTRAWFEFQDCMNQAGEDEDKLDSVLTGVQSINSLLAKNADDTPVQRGAHRADKFIVPVPESDVSVLNPNISRNKGCGRRIKSAREIAIETGNGRKCGRCNGSGHNVRTCTQNKEPV